MKKILTICILIILIVISSEYFLKKKIFKDFDYIIAILNTIDEKNNKEIRTKEIDNLYSFIENEHLLMAFYIDHVELKNIETQIIIIKASVDESDDAFLHEEVQRTIFNINHLKQKINFKF